MRGIVIAGTHSGCGKTTVTLGILAALKKKGLRVQPFKTGPDFIDAGLHRLVADRPSRNLDQWMCGPEYFSECFKRHSADADISVIEGVMGMHDGDYSTASLARFLDVPVVLVIDGKVSLCVLDEQWPPTYLVVYCDATVEREPRAVGDH